MLIDYIKKLITPDMVFFGVPSGQSGIVDLTGKNPSGQCFGTHPNVPVISKFQPPNLLVDGGLNLWDDANNLTNYVNYPTVGSTINREAIEKVEGEFSCRLDIDAINSTASFYQYDIALTPLKKYKITIWHKNSLPDKTGQLAFYDAGPNVYLKADSTWQDAFQGIVLPNSTIYVPYEIEFYAHKDYSSYKIRLSKNNAPSSSIYYDKLSIEELKPSVINPAVGWRLGGDDYIDCGNDKSLDVVDGVTIGGWVNSQGDQAAWSRVVDKVDSYWLGLNPANDKPYIGVKCAGGIGSKYFTSALPIGTFTLLIGTYNSSDNMLKTFINGNLDTQAVHGHGGNILTSAEPAIIGGTALAGYNAYIVLPFIANKAWSAAQAKNFYLNTKSLFWPRG